MYGGVVAGFNKVNVQQLLQPLQLQQLLQQLLILLTLSVIYGGVVAMFYKLDVAKMKYASNYGQNAVLFILTQTHHTHCMLQQFTQLLQVTTTRYYYYTLLHAVLRILT